jgi:replicative DNA helicase
MERIYLPESLDAEQAIIGGLMLNNKTIEQIADKITTTDFYRVEHQLIFDAISSLSAQQKPFDVITVLDALKKNKKDDNAGGEAYLWELANNTPSVANIEHYVDIVKDKSVKRQVIKLCQETMSEALGNREAIKTSSDILDELGKNVLDLSNQRAQKKTSYEMISSAYIRAVERIDDAIYNGKNTNKIPTGLTDLDDKIGGLKRKELIIVGARPSMGKTSFAMNIAYNVAIKQRLAVLVFSMEMSTDSLTDRLLSSACSIELQKIPDGKLNDSDWSKIHAAVSLSMDSKLMIDDTPALSPAELRIRARRATQEHGQLGLIVIDYLQMMRVPGFKNDNHVREIAQISNSLKQLAKELNVPIVALSQLNRNLENRQDKRPQMADIRESGAIEQDADLICFIYRDEVYNEDSLDKGIAELIISKNRNGPTGNIKARFVGQYARFEDLN